MMITKKIKQTLVGITLVAPTAVVA